MRLGSPRRPSSVGSPPFPGRTWRWWRRASKPAKAWAARGGDRWPSPVGADDPNNYQIIVELNVSTRGANPRNCGGVNRCRQTARLRATSLGRLEISLPPEGGSPCHSYASDASLRDVQFEHSGRATYGDLARGKRGRCPSGSPATSAARAWRDRLQARAARGFAPSNGTRQKHSCTDTCRRRDSPPQIVLSGGDRDTGDGAQLGVSSAHARALVAPPSLCIFHTAFIQKTYAVWFLHLCKIRRLLPQSL